MNVLYISARQSVEIIIVLVFRQGTVTVKGKTPDLLNPYKKVHPKSPFIVKSSRKLPFRPFLVLLGSELYVLL